MTPFLLVASLLLGQQDADRLARDVVDRLDADRLEDREQAERDLEKMGAPAVAALKRAQESAKGEYADRIKRVLRVLLLRDPFAEKLLDTLDDGKQSRWIYFGAKGHVAYIAGGIQARHVVLDGVAGEDFEKIEKLAFSPDGTCPTYIAERGGKAFVVIGDRKFGPYQGVGLDAIWAKDPIVFSRDGRRIAFQAHEKGRRVVVVDGAPQEAFDDVDHPVFSPDGKRVAYAANRGGEYKDGIYRVRGGQWSIVADGKWGEEFNGVGLTSDILVPSLSPTFSPDGRRMAYRAGDQKKYFVVVDGHRGEEFEYILGIQFSPDSRHLAYLAHEKNNWIVVLDGKREGPFGDVLLQMVFSPDGRHLAYPVSLGKTNVSMVLDGKKGEEFDSAYFPCFSADSKRLAYEAERAGKHFIVFDGWRGPEFDQVGHLVFDAEGNEVIYVATRGKKKRVVRGSKEGEEFDEIVTTEANPLSPLKRAPASSTVAYRARLGGLYDGDAQEYKGAQWFVVVGDRRVGPFDRTWEPHFSPDGKKVSFGALKGQELWWKVVDAP